MDFSIIQADAAQKILEARVGAEGNRSQIAMLETPVSRCDSLSETRTGQDPG
jgi:hypothetical protein